MSWPRGDQLAISWALKTGEHAEKRALSATRRPEESEELALINIERHVFNGYEIVEPLARHSRSGRSASWPDPSRERSRIAAPRCGDPHVVAMEWGLA